MDILKYAVMRKKYGGNGGNSGGGGGEEEANLAKALIERTITEISVDTVDMIGKYAFSYWDTLTTVNFPNVTSVDYYAFAHCKALENVEMPNLTSIGDYGFYGNSKLRNISFQKVESVGARAFHSSGIAKADFPNIKTVPTSVFESCYSLTSVNLPVAEELNNGAFKGCINIYYLDFPHVKTINSSVFSGARYLDVVILRDTSQVCALANTDAFTNTPFGSGKAGGKLLIPRALVDGYENGTNWSALLAGNVNNKYLALEDYTVDGTITGAIDMDKLNAA